jgi:hypothetical protein
VIVSDPMKRPKAKELLQHPLFWDEDMIIEFLKVLNELTLYQKHGNGIRDLEAIHAKTPLTDFDDKRKELEECQHKILVHFEQLAPVVFDADWSDTITEKMKSEGADAEKFLKKRKRSSRSDYNKLEDLLFFTRNLYMHPEPDFPGQTLSWMLDLFPLLLPAMLKIAIQHHEGEIPIMKNLPGALVQNLL